MKSFLKRRLRCLSSGRVWVGYWIALFVATHVPDTGTGTMGVDHADKVVHVAMYYLLVWLGGRYLYPGLGRGLPCPNAARTLWVWAAVYCAYGGADEWLQQFVSRTPSLGDWVADSAGIIGATLWLTWSRPTRRLSEPGGG